MVDIDSISDLLCNIREAMRSHFYPKEESDARYAAKEHSHLIDDELDANSGNPVSNHALTPIINGKADSEHSHDIDDVTDLQTELDSKSDEGHKHNVSQVNGLQSLLDGKAPNNHTHPVDSSLSNISANPVQNKVINNALADKAPSSHTHSISQVTNLQSSLDNKAGLDPASQQNKGLMSASDKVRLDGMATGATKNKRGVAIIVTSPADSSNQPLIRVSKGTQLSVKVVNAESGTGIPNVSISWAINGVVHTEQVDGTGVRKITINLEYGMHNIFFSFNGTDMYLPVYKPVMLEVV